MQKLRYQDEYAPVWDALIEASRNGTFLFKRAYMDYHRDRFNDCSLMFFKKDKCVGVLPASYKEGRVVSHGGLTYGGLVTLSNIKYKDVEEMLEGAVRYYAREMKQETLVYKAVPYIYGINPFQEDLYWIFRHEGWSLGRSLASTIDMAEPVAYTELRGRQIKKATRAGVTIEEAKDDEAWKAFWEILTAVLQERHHCLPVHSLAEIRLLQGRFPKEIRLFVARKEGKVVAGTVLYIMHNVVHAQYISAGSEGRSLGALDKLFAELLQSELCKQHRYFDFGISTEEDGSWLNEGLQFQKEGFGGRGVCYEWYQLDLKQWK